MVCNSRVILNFAYHKPLLKKEIQQFHLFSLISLHSLCVSHIHQTPRYTQIDVKR